MPDGFKETGGCWEFKEEELDYSQWITGFGKCCGPDVKRISKLMHIRSWTERSAMWEQHLPYFPPHKTQFFPKNVT
jgi:hypothetical protein